MLASHRALTPFLPETHALKQQRRRERLAAEQTQTVHGVDRRTPELHVHCFYLTLEPLDR